MVFKCLSVSVRARVFISCLCISVCGCVHACVCLI